MTRDVLLVEIDRLHRRGCPLKITSHILSECFPVADKPTVTTMAAITEGLVSGQIKNVEFPESRPFREQLAEFCERNKLCSIYLPESHSWLLGISDEDEA